MPALRQSIPNYSVNISKTKFGDQVGKSRPHVRRHIHTGLQSQAHRLVIILVRINRYGLSCTEPTRQHPRQRPIFQNHYLTAIPPLIPLAQHQMFNLEGVLVEMILRGLI